MSKSSEEIFDPLPEDIEEDDDEDSYITMDQTKIIEENDNEDDSFYESMEEAKMKAVKKSLEDEKSLDIEQSLNSSFISIKTADISEGSDGKSFMLISWWGSEKFQKNWLTFTCRGETSFTTQYSSHWRFKGSQWIPSGPSLRDLISWLNSEMFLISQKTCDRRTTYKLF